MTPSTHVTSTKMQRILYASWSCWLPPRVLLPIWFPQLTWMPQLAAAESPPASRWPWSTQENLGHLIKVLIYWKHQMVPPPCSRIDRHHMHWPHTRIYPGYQNKMWKNQKIRNQSMLYRKRQPRFNGASCGKEKKWSFRHQNNSSDFSNIAYY